MKVEIVYLLDTIMLKRVIDSYNRNLSFDKILFMIRLVFGNGK